MSGNFILSCKLLLIIEYISVGYKKRNSKCEMKSSNQVCSNTQIHEICESVLLFLHCLTGTCTVLYGNNTARLHYYTLE